MEPVFWLQSASFSEDQGGRELRFLQPLNPDTFPSPSDQRGKRESWGYKVQKEPKIMNRTVIEEKKMDWDWNLLLCWKDSEHCFSQKRNDSWLAALYWAPKGPSDAAGTDREKQRCIQQWSRSVKCENNLIKTQKKQQCCTKNGVNLDLIDSCSLAGDGIQY